MLVKCFFPCYDINSLVRFVSYTKDGLSLAPICHTHFSSLG